MTVSTLIVVLIGFFTLTKAVASDVESESNAVPSHGEAQVDFAKEVRPILSAHCFACHGPDEEDRQAGVRLDTASGIAEVAVAEAGDLSLFVERIRETDEDVVMPPPGFHKPLSESQKATLEAWVRQGATFTDHWSFATIMSKTPPPAETATASTTVDAFLNRSIQENGLPVNEIADRRTLLRRVALDLTGLPPSEQIKTSFLNDSSPDAYESLVDRLLEEPAYGEHMARYWLDLVRFADTHGLHLDNYREMWPYRDWVIDAFTNNKPFDEFVIEQVAGDLLPDATRAQKIASGFNRLNVTTSEGGSIYDEVFTRNVIDRTDAFGTVFLGLTVGCAVCHDHKFDPISSRDYYSLSAYFNSLDGSALDGNKKDPAPVLKVTTEQQDAESSRIVSELAGIRKQKRGEIPTVDAAQRTWEQSVFHGKPSNSEPLNVVEATSSSGATMEIVDDGSVRLVGDAADTDTTTIVAVLPAGLDWQTLRLEAIADAATERVGASNNGNVVLSEITIATSPLANGSEVNSTAIASAEWLPVDVLNAFADVEQDGDKYSISFAHDGKTDDKSAGWAVAGHQQTGGRNAWLSIPPIGEDGPSLVRVQLKYLSQFAKHQFRSVRLFVSDGPPTVPDNKRIVLGDLYTAGPFQVESPNAGYSRDAASIGKKFNADEDFVYEGRKFRWQHRHDIQQVVTNRLPVIDDRASVLVLHQSLESPSAQKIQLLIGADDGYHVHLNGKRIGVAKAGNGKSAGDLKPLRNTYDLPLVKGNNRLYIKVVNHEKDSRLTFAYRSAAIDTPPELAKLFALPADQRDLKDRDSVRRYYREVHCVHPDWGMLVSQEKALVKAQQDLQNAVTTTLVWKETKKPRQAHVLLRGQYDDKGDEVPRATPSFLPSMSQDLPNNRLGLARWLTDPSHPLTARVAVNRFWQQLFGTGLVKTSEDFGSQGEPPSHPELLDWLANDFIQSGWNVKGLLKTMVMTDAYRRSASVLPRHLHVDPENRFLARGPRFRLDAEVLRDQALALSGLLVDRRGGKSVKPPQPSGLWYAVGYTRSNTANFVADSGDDIYRRSLYVFWKRTSPPPQMSTFDAPSRESCTARRERTNTPLQALVMLNETQYLESAKAIAKTVVSELPRRDLATSLGWLFEHVTTRQPNKGEQNELRVLLADLTAHYESKPDEAAELVGESNASLAAWTMLASTVLNLDEVVTK